MLAPHRRQAERPGRAGVVIRRVLLVTDAEEAEVEQTCCGSEHPLAVSVDAPTSQSARKRAVTRAVKEVAHYLGNTPTVCRASYVDPRVIDLYNDGVTVRDDLDRLGAGAQFGELATQGAIEQAVLHLLREPDAVRRRIRATAARRASGSRAA